MMTTLSPQSTCGVKLGLCLPFRRMATNDARRPRMTPSASTRIHFLSFAAARGVTDTVDIDMGNIRHLERRPLWASKAAEYLFRGLICQSEKAKHFRFFAVR